MSHNSGNDAGSEHVHEPAFLVLGRLRRAHGIAGEIALEVHTRMPELLDEQKVVYIGDSHLPYTIQATRWKGNLLLLKFDEFNDRTQVSQLTNALVYTRADELPLLPEDDYYLHELIGLHVYEANGQYLGELSEILETGANDVYLIRDDDGTEVLIPAIEERILEINLDEGKMVVTPTQWYGEGD